MKKTLSIALALCLAVSMIASFALIAPGPATSSDPLTLVSIKVTDAAGYAAPYAAIDSAYAFVENQTAYVVFCVQVRSQDTSDGIADLDEFADRTIRVTSSTLDLTYAPSTLKIWEVWHTGAIDPDSLSHHASSTYDYATNTYKLVFKAHEIGMNQPEINKDLVNRYYFAFIAVTRAASAGDVRASLDVAKTSFAAYTPLSNFNGNPLPGSLILNAYAADGLRYKIIDNGGTGTSFWVLDEDNDFLVAYNNNGPASMSGVKFDAIYATKTVNGYDWVKVSPDYTGRLTYENAAGVKVDITDLVNSINSFFGFSFANTGYPVLRKHFEDKTVGNPIIISDTYNYVTAVVTQTDEDIDIAQTGDFSANIVIVMAASAVLAAAALAFVAKKVRD